MRLQGCPWEAPWPTWWETWGPICHAHRCFSVSHCSQLNDSWNVIWNISWNLGRQLCFCWVNVDMGGAAGEPRRNVPGRWISHLDLKNDLIHPAPCYGRGGGWRVALFLRGTLYFSSADKVGGVWGDVMVSRGVIGRRISKLTSFASFNKECPC